MSVEATDALGLAAGALTAGAFVPQVLRTWRRRDATGLSPPTYAMLAAGVFGWIVYGVSTEDVAIVVTNVVTFVLVGAVGLMTWLLPRS